MPSQRLILFAATGLTDRPEEFTGTDHKRDALEREHYSVRRPEPGMIPAPVAPDEWSSLPAARPPEAEAVEIDNSDNSEDTANSGLCREPQPREHVGIRFDTRREHSFVPRFTTIAMLDRACEFGAHVTAASKDLRKHEDQEHSEQPGYRDMDRIVNLRAHGVRCEQVNHRLDQRVDHVDAQEQPGDADEVHGVASMNGSPTLAPATTRRKARRVH